MNRNWSSPAFRSFLDGIVLLAFAALFLTVQVTPLADLAVASASGNDLQPFQATLLPSIMSAGEPAPAARPLPAAATDCYQVQEHQTEVLVIVVRRGDGSSAEIIPTVVRPEV